MSSYLLKINFLTNYSLTNYTYIYIYIKSRCKHGFPLFSFSIRPSLLPGLLTCILCLRRAVIGKFLLGDQHWHVHVKGSMGECHLWVLSCFFSSVPHVLFVLLGWFLTWYIYIYIYIYKQDLLLNNPQRLIYHKTRTNQQIVVDGNWFISHFLVSIKLTKEYKTIYSIWIYILGNLNLFNLIFIQLNNRNTILCNHYTKYLILHIIAVY